MCCSGDKILNFKSLKIIFYSVVGAFIALLISGCVSVVPGTEYGGSYCVATKNTKEYRESVKTSTFSYGRYKNYSVSRNGTLCGLVKFHILNIKWETQNGIIREENIDVQQLMVKLKSEYKIPIAYGSPKLEIQLEDEKLMLFYHIYDLNPDISHEDRYVTYSLLK